MKEFIIYILLCIAVALIWQYTQNRYFHRYEIVVAYDKRRVYRGTLKQCESKYPELDEHINPAIAIRCIQPNKTK
jgi:hypothetical protein